MSGFRHELKYLCSEAQLRILATRFLTVMSRDPHTDGSCQYLIRSIYFDDDENQGYHDNLDGVAPREKWRIRAYNADSSHIRLECKRREKDLIRKTSCALTLPQYEALIHPGPGSDLFPAADQPALLNRFLILKKTRRLAPVIIVQYEREPFILSDGNVRVTLDRRIASSGMISGFFSRSLPTRPILPAGQHLLEIKYDAFLPDVIRQTAQLRGLQQSAFSKYALCRRYALDISRPL